MLARTVPAVKLPLESITIKNGRALPLPRRVLLLTSNSRCCLGSRDRGPVAGYNSRLARCGLQRIYRAYLSFNKGESMSATAGIPVGASAEKAVTVTRE